MYDSIMVDVEIAASDVKVKLQQGGAGQVKALIVNSGRYGNEATYKVNNSGNTPIALNQPLNLIAEGAVGLLDIAPERLFFSNTLPDLAEILILIDRHAMPASCYTRFS